MGQKLAAFLTIATAFLIPLSTALTNVSFILAAVLNLACYWPSFKLRPILAVRPLSLMAGLFGLLLVGCFYSSASWLDALSILKKYSGLLLAVFLVPTFTVVKWRHYAINAFLVAMLLNFPMFILAKYLPALPWHFDEGFRGHIGTSLLAAVASYIFLSKAYFSHSMIKRLLSLLFTGCMMIYLFSGIGRSGYLIFTVLLILFCWQVWRWRGIMVAAFALGMIVAVAASFSATFSKRIIEVREELSAHQQGFDFTSTGERLSFWKNSLFMIKNHPILGSGTGSFSGEFLQAYQSQGVPLTHNPHNEYLNITVQLGLVGLFYLLFMFFSQWHDTKQLEPLFKMIAQAVILAIMTGSLVNSWLMDSLEGHFYAYFIALSFAGLVAKNRN